MNLEHLRPLRRAVVRARHAYYTRVFGMHIDPTVEMSFSAKLDRRYPQGVHIGHHTYLALGSMILTHDMTRGIYRDTIVGPNCFVGAKSLIMPGVKVGEGSIIGAGAVVTKDVPAFSAVAGNPAVVIMSDIETGAYGRLKSAGKHA